MRPDDVAGESTPSPATRISPILPSTQPLTCAVTPHPARLARNRRCEKPAPSARRIADVDGTLASPPSSSATCDQARLPNTRPSATTSGASPTPADAPAPAAMAGPLGAGGGLTAGGGGSAITVGGGGGGGGGGGLSGASVVASS